MDTKIAVVVREDLQTWQKLNVTAFTISGIAGTKNVMGKDYMDGSGVTYLPMIKQPVMIFSATGEKMKTIYNRARQREVEFTVYTEELFSTPNDNENRAAVKAVDSKDLNLVGMAFFGEKKVMDKVLKGVSLHS